MLIYLLIIFVLVFLLPGIFYFTGNLKFLNNKNIKPSEKKSKDSSEIHDSNQDFRDIIEERSKSGLIDTEEQELLENVVDFSDTPVWHIMVPRTHISAIDIDDPQDTIVSIFIEEGFSRLPVYKGTIDNIIGEIYGKDLLNMLANNNLIILEDIIRPPFFVQEDEKIHRLIKIMQKYHHHLAIVLSEFGGVSGIVTMEDIIEEIFGEIQDEYDEDVPLATQIATNEYEVDASISIDDVNEILPATLEESEDYKTLAGFITNNIGRFPREGEEFFVGSYKFEITKSSERKIETVKMQFIKNIDDEKK